MNVVTIINELRQELERIDGLILALESLRSGRKRGRPPKALQALRAGGGGRSSAAAKPKGRGNSSGASKTSKPKP
jgi:hypothetical protein